MLTKTSYSKRFLFTFIYLIFFFSSTLSIAAPNFIKAKKSAEPISNNLQEDILGRNTPRGTVEGLLSQAAHGNRDRLLRFFDFEADVPLEHRKKTVEDFLKLLDMYGDLIATASLSNTPIGRLEDSIESNVEKVGTIQYENKNIPVLLERIKRKDGRMIWLISRGTLSSLPLSVNSDHRFTLKYYFPTYLKNKKVLGAPYSDWILILSLIPFCFLIAFFLAFLLKKVVIRRMIKRDSLVHLTTPMMRPLLLFIASSLYTFLVGSLDVSIIVRQFLSFIPLLISCLALTLFLGHLIEVSSHIFQDRAEKNNELGKLSGILFFKAVAKFFLYCTALIIGLSLIGVDISKGIAALGIGGLALALGAQKTIENLVASLMVIFDQPVRVGDYCKVAGIEGTVENIGLRSVRIRTLDRTIVAIPNSEFSNQKIENYAHRDKFFFKLTLHFSFESSADQIRFLLVELRSLLYKHERVLPDPSRVRFVDINRDSYTIEVFTYVSAQNKSDFLGIKEDINLRIMDIIDESGTYLSSPVQTMYVSENDFMNKEKSKSVDSLVNDWKLKQSLKLPEFDEDTVSSIENSLHYPSKESIQSTKKG